MSKFAYVSPWRAFFFLPGAIKFGPKFNKLPKYIACSVYTHELGHLKLFHIHKRIWWIISLKAFFKNKEYYQFIKNQEFEADAFCAEMGYAKGLCRFFDITDSKLKLKYYPTNAERRARLTKFM